MPKELIHFKIAEITAQQLSDSRFSPILNKHPSALLLGAVFHDALFYGITSTAYPMERLSHRLHGAWGEDTFALLRLQAAQVINSPTPSLPAALLVGMVSHIYADTVMHPMVWHLTGNYYGSESKKRSQVRQHHRALESLMDMVACPEMINRPTYRIRNLLRRTGTDLYDALPLTAMAELAETSERQARKGVQQSFRIFATLQSLFGVNRLADGLFALRPFLPRTVNEIGALFYPSQLMKQADHLRGPIDFQHPVSGVHHAASLEEMIHGAASRAAATCRQLEPALFDGMPMAIPEHGPSMDAGMSGVSTDRMRYFATTPFPDLD